MPDTVNVRGRSVPTILTGQGQDLRELKHRKTPTPQSGPSPRYEINVGGTNNPYWPRDTVLLTRIIFIVSNITIES